MIELSNEEVVPLAEAAEFLPRVRRGRKVSYSSLYRWAASGRRGVKLETIFVGGTRCTSREALQRFCDALTAGPGKSRGTSRTSAKRGRQIDAAEAAVASAGV